MAAALEASPEAQLRQKLLNRVAAFYHKSFQDQAQPQAALKALGLTDVSLFADFKVGFADGTLLSTIPDRSELQEALKSLGLLMPEGKEAFEGCVTFPWFNENSDCVGLWALRISDGEGLYLPGPRVGVWNWQAMKRSRHVLLVSSILDALFFYQAGYREVVPLWGVGQSAHGLTDDHKRAFQRYGLKEVFLTFEAGDEIYRDLEEEEITVRAVKLPSSVPEFFRQAGAAKIFETLLTEANPKTSLESERLRKAKEMGWERTDTGFVVQYGERRYEIKSIQKEGVKLKATVKAFTPGKEEWFLDSVDLYSHRSRVFFAKACKEYFREKAEVIEADLGKLLELAERFQAQPKESAQAVKLTHAEEKEALALLKDPQLLERILEDFERCGYTGEEGNKLMGYLAAVSRKLEEPISILIQSRSAAGKSSLQDAILAFVPPEDVEKYTRLTGQALFYKDESGLCHKLLAIEEEAGAREASYSIRNLQSSKFLSIATTEKDPVTGKLRTVEYRVKGPVALMLTTTAVDMDFETQNRFITLTIDESPEMTKRILERQRELETLAGLSRKRGQDGVARRHQNAQRLLKPLAVVNPYAPKLTFPANSLRARRDHKKYLGLIRAIAFLHQYQREVKTHVLAGGEEVQYVEVILADIERANRLSGKVLGQTMGELSAPGWALLAKVREMVKEHGKSQEYKFTRRDIREYSGWSDFQVKTHIGELEDLEYLYTVTGKKGKEYVYELAAPVGGEVSNGHEGGTGEDGKPFLAGLTKVETLA
jgi:hypothetical protein